MWEAKNPNWEMGEWETENRKLNFRLKQCDWWIENLKEISISTLHQILWGLKYLSWKCQMPNTECWIHICKTIFHTCKSFICKFLTICEKVWKWFAGLLFVVQRLRKFAALCTNSAQASFYRFKTFRKMLKFLFRNVSAAVHSSVFCSTPWIW